MKTIFKLKYSILLVLALAFTSCETTNLDLLEDPNNPSAENADLDRYLNAIQVSFPRFLFSAQNKGAELTRIEHMRERIYDNYASPTSQDFMWRTAYDYLLDVKSAEAIAEEQGALKHLVVLKVIKAYTYMVLVDYFGDVPFSQANDSENFPFPQVDSGEEVYAQSITMLNEVIDLIDNQNASDASDLQNDFYYGNSMSKWKKAANTLLMEAYLNTRLVDGSAMSKFNAIVASGDYISSSSDDFVFQYGTSESNPDTRHPAYANNYISSGAADYSSNWLMNEMLMNNDPRIKLYYYRQVGCVPGNVDSGGTPCDINLEELQCVTFPFPGHYETYMPFCSLPSGYWGRDHGDDSGTPPDGLKRTTYGVYPIGGRFDNGFFIPVAPGQGGGGAGILPIMLASYSQFMIAEMKLLAGDDAGAQTAIESGIQISGDKAISFADLDSGAIGAFVPTSSDVSAYASTIGANFAAGTADEKWEILATQNFITRYGNGIGAYNQYRRTGYPKRLQYNIEANPGIFVRSFYYPANEVNANSNITQKPNVGVKVFWDNNPDSPSFPSAN